MPRFSGVYDMTTFYKKHLFFCVNQKLNGKKCCAESPAEALCAYMKKRLQIMGQHGKGLFRVSSSGCLGRCAKGPSLVIYPDNVWYSFANERDIDEIIESHLLSGEVVSRLLMPEEM